MPLEILKFLDTAARSLFVLVVLYLLPIKDSAKFGMIVTLVGFYTFICGFEYYKEFQRSIASQSEDDRHGYLDEVLKFFIVNNVICSAVLAIVLSYWVGLMKEEMLYVLAIAFSEHLSVEAYRLSLFVPRLKGCLWVVVIKNCLLVLAVAYSVLLGHNKYELISILQLWGLLSSFGLLVMVFVFFRYLRFQPINQPIAPLLHFSNFYAPSMLNFWIGIVAVASLQLDRVVVSSLVSIESAGVYFRNIFVAAFFYQMAGVLSHGRVMNRLCLSMQSGRINKARLVIRAELKRLVLWCAITVPLLIVMSHFFQASIPRLASLDLTLVFGLLVAYALRLGGDYVQICLTATRHENIVLWTQCAAIIVAFIFNIFLIPHFDLFGAVGAFCIGAAVYVIGLTFFSGFIFDK